MASNITVDNAEVMRRLSEMGARITPQTLTIAHKIGALMMTTAKLAVPVAEIDGSTLRSSLHSEVEATETGVRVTVGTAVHYAPHVEFGTGDRGIATGNLNYPLQANSGKSYTVGWPGMVAQPYLRPALYENWERIQKAIADGYMRELI